MEGAALTLCLLLQACLSSAVLVPHARVTEKALPVAALEYSNDWAVQIQGGPEIVSLIADTHGFINMGQVLKAYSFFFHVCMFIG